MFNFAFRGISRGLINKTFTCRTGQIRLFASSADPYDTLGVSRDADESTIKNAYFKLSKKYHPDKNPQKDAQEVFVKIHLAYRSIMEAFEKESDQENTSNSNEHPRQG